MLSLVKGFIAKRVMVGLTGALALLFGNQAAGRVSELLMDPDFIKQVFDLGGLALVVWSALAGQKTDPIQHQMDSIEQTILQNLPDLEDPYPGWDYDPLRGWVQINA